MTKIQIHKLCIAIIIVAFSITFVGNNSYAQSNQVGTISNGGVFTPQVRAFLDAIAKYESETDYLNSDSYNSGNYVANDFDANLSNDLKPKLKSGGVAPKSVWSKYGSEAWNIGRYQYYSGQYTMADIESANKGLKLAGIDFVIKDFKPTTQDYYPLGKYALRASILKKTQLNLSILLSSNEYNFNETIGIASQEWASLPVVNGYRHADAKQAKWNLSEFIKFYNQRVSVYNSQNNVVTEPKPIIEKPIAQNPTIIVTNTKYVTLKSKTDNTKCLDLRTSKIEENNTIQLWKCNKTDAQKWEMKDGLIKSKINGEWCINNEFLDITLNKCNEDTANWILTSNNEIKPTFDEDLCITLSNKSGKIGEKLVLDYCDNSNYQKWNL
jgi:hypothetical protein